MINFENPAVFAGLLGIPLFYWALQYFQNKQLSQIAIWGQHWEGGLQDPQNKSSKIFRWMASVFLTLLVIALANPRHRLESTSTTMAVKDIFIALDLSKSMDATDLPPSRLEVAKKRTIQFLDEMKGNRIALILFAGESYLAMPLTTDPMSAVSMVSSLNTGQMALQGTNIKEAANIALEANKRMGQGDAIFLLITDGEDHEGGALSALEKLADNGFDIFIAGIGTEQGGTIMGPEGVLTDEAGQVVRSQLNKNLILEMAEQSHGIVLDVNDTNWSRKVDSAIKNNQKSGTVERKYKSYKSYAHVPLLLAALVLCVGFYFSRIGFSKKMTLLLVVFTSVTSLMKAQDPKPFVEGNRLYQSEKYKEAQKKYEEGLKAKEDARAQYNLGNSQYKSGNLDEAVQNFEKAAKTLPNKDQQSKAWHNLGNAQYKKGRLGEAIEAYKEALRLNPGEKSSSINLAIAKQQQQKQQKQQQQQSEPKNQKDLNQGGAQGEKAEKNEPNKGKSEKQAPSKNKGNNKNESDMTNGKGKSNPESAWSEDKAMLDHIEREEQKVRGQYRRGDGKSSKIKKPW
ncbi:MAG: tetratricopeptide repeat protein [Saprospiraceae bacterium]|nr:tetratricopeptide repeat protein [Saprospiraceae bacterium]